MRCCLLFHVADDVTEENAEEEQTVDNEGELSIIHVETVSEPQVRIFLSAVY